MKKRTVILIFMIISLGSLHSQNLSDSLLINFFDRTFNDYFLGLNSQKKDFYILKDSIPKKVATDYGKFTLHLVDYTQAYPLIKKRKYLHCFGLEENM